MSISEKKRSFTSRRNTRRKLSDAPLPSVSTAVQGSVATPYDSSKLRTKLLLVPFRSGEAVSRHPEVMPYLKEGWNVKSAAPRVTPEGTKLLVVLG